MNFNPEVTLGNILTIATFVVAVVGAFYTLKGKSDVLIIIIQQYNERFARMETRHEQRLTKLEDNDQKLTQMVQQLIGQNEERRRWDGHERRNHIDRNDRR